MYTELRQKRFQGYSRSVASSCCGDFFFFHVCIQPEPSDVKLPKSDSAKLFSFSEILFFLLCRVVLTWPPPLYIFRFCMPMRENAGRRPTWRRSHRATRPTVSHTKAMSSSPRYITSLPTARPAPSLCGMSSSRLRRWSAAAATSSATRTTSTKRRMLLLLAKVKNSTVHILFVFSPPIKKLQPF